MRTKRTGAILAVLLIAQLGVLPGTARAATTLVVDDDGRASADDCDSPLIETPHTTITSAVNAAASGDTILVCGGTYDKEGDRVWIHKSLTILGAETHGVAPEARSSDAVAHFLNEPVLKAARGFWVEERDQPLSATIDGFTVTGAATGSGIEVRGGGLNGHSFRNNILSGNQQGAFVFADDVTLRGNLFENNTQNGIFVGGDDIDVNERLVIDGNDFSGHPGSAIVLASFTDGAILSNNTSTGSGDFAAIFRATGAQILGNTISSQGGSAFYLGGINDRVHIEGNDVTGGGIGVEVASYDPGDGGPRFAPNMNTEIVANNIAGTGRGVFFAPSGHSGGAHIDSNDISDTTEAIYLTSGSDHSIGDNELAGNEMGIVTNAVAGNGIYIAANFISGSEDGMLLRGTGMEILSNQIFDNEIGISMQPEGLPMSIVRGNNFRDNDGGLTHPDGTGLFVGGKATELLVEENNFAGHPQSAITLLGSPSVGIGEDIEVRDNVSNGDDSFVATFRMKDVMIHGNTVEAASGSSIYIGGVSSGIDVRNNTITGGDGPALNVAHDFPGQYASNLNKDVTVTGNQLLSNSSGITIAANAYAGTLEAHGNRIFGNNIGVANSDSDSILDASDNWWGCNEGPRHADCDGAAAAIDVTPWLELEVSSDPTEIGQDETSTVTARVINADATIPFATPIDFATDLGSFSVEEQTLDSGVAYADLIPDGDIGTATVTASVDAEAQATSVRFFPGTGDDLDGDGQSNADEGECGSDPRDASSRSADTDEDGAVDCTETHTDTVTVGRVTDPEATSGEMMLRYAGDPAPAGYSRAFQWSTPYVEAAPEAGPVTFSGTLDLSDQVGGSVALIGLVDKQALLGGATGYHTGAYIYAFKQENGDVKLGVSDGNAGGELIQAATIVDAATAAAGPLAVTFTIDGTVDPTTCAVPLSPRRPDTAPAEGCMTLAVEGSPPISDSYGGITAEGHENEFAGGGVPGWDAFPGGSTGVRYDFTLSPTLADPDRDGDGASDDIDEFRLDPSETEDADSDGTGDNADTDDDNDGTDDAADAFPNDATESSDADSDGTGDNADTDDDNDGTDDPADAFPNDSKENSDSDGDRVGDNADNCESAPNASQTDSDGDGLGDECDSTPNGSVSGSGGSGGGGGSTPTPSPSASSSATPTPSASPTPTASPSPSEDPDDDDVRGDRSVRTHTNIRFNDGFRGRVRAIDATCVSDRIVALKRKRADGSTVRRGRDVTDAMGRWAIDRMPVRGRWFVVVKERELTSESGGTTTCLAERSATIRLPLV